MDYLYEELPAERMAEVAAWLEDHPEAKAELEELQGVRAMMHPVPDTPVQRPVLMLSQEAVRRPRRWWPTAVAAALLLLMVALVGLRMQVQVGNGTLTLAFGTPTPKVDTVDAPEFLTRAEVDALIAQQVALLPTPKPTTDPDSLRRALEQWKGKLLGQMVAMQVAQAREQAETLPVGVTQEEFFTTLQEMQEENVRLMMALLAESDQNLREDLQQTLVQLSAYYDEVRSQDQSVWESQLANLQQETQETQQKTDLLYNVLVSNTNE